MVKFASTIIVYLQVFIGMGAIAGGIPMILTPDGSKQGLTTALLESTPFDNYMIPGILLVAINGIGSLLGAWGNYNNKSFAPILTLLLGMFLIFWIIVQTYFFGMVSLMQPLFLIIGILELIAGIILAKNS